MSSAWILIDTPNAPRISATTLIALGTIAIILVLSSWILFAVVSHLEPGYIGYPEPSSTDRSLVRRLRRYAQSLVDGRENLSSCIYAYRERETSSAIDIEAKRGDDIPMRELAVAKDVNSTGTQQSHAPDDGKQRQAEQHYRPTSLPVVSLATFADIPRRFCEICCVDQPVRTRHCYRCGQCVLRFGMAMIFMSRAWFFFTHHATRRALTFRPPLPFYGNVYRSE